MRAFDMVMRPIDSFWKKRCFQAEMDKRRAEASARCSDGLLAQSEEDLMKARKKAAAQAAAIEAYNRELLKLRELLSDAENRIEKQDLEISMLREVLEAERDAKRALRTARLVIRESAEE